MPLLAFGLACIFGSIAVFIGILLAVDNRSPVLALARDVPAGKRIDAGDLRVARVAADGIPTVPASRRSVVVGKIALRSLEADTLLKPDQIATTAPSIGDVVVGVALEPGQLPNGLSPGDTVRVVDTGQQGEGKPIVLAWKATVFSISQPSHVSDAVVVSLILPPGEGQAGDMAARVAAAAADRRISLLLVSGGGG
jgi:hypothetical protein